MRWELTAAALNVLKAIDAGELRPSAPRRTLLSLWRRGIIEDTFDIAAGVPAGWKLTGAGVLALRTGQLRISSRREP